MTVQQGSEMNTAQIPESEDFSLVLGGPVFQLFRKAHMTGDGLELVRRRVLAIALFTWLPLLVLSLVGGQAINQAIGIPFLHDIEVHVRFLVALPVLIGAELIIHRRISPLMRRFTERQIVRAEDLPQFNAALTSALRIRNSVTIEVVLFVLVYSVGLWVWRSQTALGSPTWYAVPEAGGLRLTLPGYWYAFVGIPISQFILLRWYMRIGLWFWLLWRVSRLNLHLSAAHPDRAGGIGFLGSSSYAFAPILFAQGALLSGLIASRVLFQGRDLVSFKMEAAGLIGFFVLMILGPLVMFTPHLMLAKRKALAEYGLLANQYVFGFEERWLGRGHPDINEMLGSGDIQSLADLGNSYQVVREMKFVPFGLSDVTRLAGATAAPLVPLTLTIFSLEELITRLIKVMF
jgi:hypothetical protein